VVPGGDPVTSVEPASDARLDRATNSPHDALDSDTNQGFCETGQWLVTQYPEAAEASIVFHRPRDEDQEIPAAGEATDPERSMLEAARRAATKIRRYATSNECDRLWSLTYDDDHLPESMGDVWSLHAEAFRERLFDAVGERFPLVLVPERGGKSGRLHLHALTNRFLPKRLVEAAWGKGFVDGRRLMAWRDIENGAVINTRAMGRRERCRAAASYLAGYVKKGFIADHEFGRHRYSTSRGFAPMSRQARFQTTAGARSWCLLTMPGRLSSSWSSQDVETWQGPPVWLGYWEDAVPPSGTPGGAEDAF
jgi:hypothetical protein